MSASDPTAHDVDEPAVTGTRGGREGILQAAVELIARDGFDGVRIADIAARAGVSTALVHYHFAVRDRLLTDALAHSLTRAEARLERRTHSSHRDTPAERLADLIDFGLPLTHEDVLECRLWAELEIRSTGSKELAAALTELRRRILAPLVSAIEDGLRTGDFRDCEPGDVATVAMALLDGLTSRLLTDPGGPTLTDARRLAAHQLTLAVGYSGELPFQPLPDPGTPPPHTQPNRATPRRRRAPRTPAPSPGTPTDT
ncbi:TetR/AcrR family transcriptional regulator [Microtetraspora niveoalba]|uniref:TetR/AcrR family transcriptional regulator n=1 Tax=Microtetraspora niveoalba TaxID=46175 RepID=UPI00082E0E25|nr:TetR/AcrR family transcriptional regulator [Microtetraspora niveoalba]